MMYQFLWTAASADRLRPQLVGGLRCTAVSARLGCSRRFGVVHLVLVGEILFGHVSGHRCGLYLVNVSNSFWMPRPTSVSTTAK